MTTAMRYLIIDEDYEVIGSTDSKEAAESAPGGYYDLQSETCIKQYIPDDDDDAE